MRPRDLALGGVALGILALVAAAWLVPAGLSKAPAVTFNTLDGRTLSLSELRGRPVLVNFWATTCTGCIKEMPHLVQLYEKLRPQGLEIIGVAMSYDPPNQVMALQERRQLPYPLALDIDAKIARAFGDVQLTPTTFLIAPDGRIVFHKIGELDMAKLEAAIRELSSA